MAAVLAAMPGALFVAEEPGVVEQVANAVSSAKEENMVAGGIVDHAVAVAQRGRYPIGGRGVPLLSVPFPGVAGTITVSAAALENYALAFGIIGHRMPISRKWRIVLSYSL